MFDAQLGCMYLSNVPPSLPVTVYLIISLFINLSQPPTSDDASTATAPPLYTRYIHTS